MQTPPRSPRPTAKSPAEEQIFTAGAAIQHLKNVDPRRHQVTIAWLRTLSRNEKIVITSKNGQITDVSRQNPEKQTVMTAQAAIAYLRQDEEKNGSDEQKNNTSHHAHITWLEGLAAHTQVVINTTKGKVTGVIRKNPAPAPNFNPQSAQRRTGQNSECCVMF